MTRSGPVTPPPPRLRQPARRPRPRRAQRGCGPSPCARTRPWPGRGRRARSCPGRSAESKTSWSTSASTWMSSSAFFAGAAAGAAAPAAAAAGAACAGGRRSGCGQAVGLLARGLQALLDLLGQLRADLQLRRRGHGGHPHAEALLLVGQLGDGVRRVLELRRPEERVEGADLDADAAVHAQREVDREAVQDVAGARPPALLRPARPPCGCRCRCTSPGTRARRACRPCSSPPSARSRRGCAAAGRA